MQKTKARLIAFYLPQYHPIPENDAWWGKGFTEWTNAIKAKPMFRGHYQPHVPADLGYYDLRLPAARQAQAEMAKQYGIEAFCYYHYWFAGKRLLEQPFDAVLESGQPDFPFCLCWANTSWTGIWHGAPDRLLIEQTYPGEEDHRRHFDFLLRAFNDPRYLRIDNKPVLVILKPEELPDAKNLLALWRQLAIAAGLPGVFFVTHYRSQKMDLHASGFDAAIPLWKLPLRKKAAEISLLHNPWQKLKALYRDFRQIPTIYDYAQAVDQFTIPPDDIEYYPCVVPNWDNTPRCGSDGRVLHGSTPELFRMHLRKALKRVEKYPDGHQVLFVKSWNEWAEGNHLEPDIRFGKRYLEIIDEELNTPGVKYEYQPR